HPDARRLGGPSFAQGLPDHRVEGLIMSDSGISDQAAAVADEVLEPPPGARRMVLNMGPQHPSTHGVLRLLLELDGETIMRCQPDIGFLHTGIEKEFEVKTYQQAVTLTDRVD